MSRPQYTDASHLVGWTQGVKKRAAAKWMKENPNPDDHLPWVVRLVRLSFLFGTRYRPCPKCRSYRPDINYFCSGCGYDGVIPAKKEKETP